MNEAGTAVESDPTGRAAHACGRALGPSPADAELKDAAARKARALSALEDADRLLGVAREEMAMLEGPHYCNCYERLGRHRSDLETLTARLRRLSPPTGIFEL